MGKNCPKCGNPFDVKSFFGKMDHKGIIAMCCHSPYYDDYGNKRWKDRCFLNLSEANDIFTFRHICGDIYELEIGDV